MCSLSGCSVCLWLTHTHTHFTHTFPLLFLLFYTNDVKHTLPQKSPTHLPPLSSASAFFSLSSSCSQWYLTHTHTHTHTHTLSTEALPWFGCPVTLAWLQLSERCTQNAKTHEHTHFPQWWYWLLLSNADCLHKRACTRAHTHTHTHTHTHLPVLH